MAIIGHPQFELEKTIEDMEVGESGYAVCWDLAFDEELTLFLNVGSLIHKEKGGSVQLPIKKIGDGRADYEVDITDVSYKWEKAKSPFSGVVGMDSSKIVRIE